MGDELLQSLNSVIKEKMVQGWDEYEKLEELGEGSYGKIYKVREISGEKRVLVIKEIDTS